MTCCYRDLEKPFLHNINNIIRKLAAANTVPYADIERAWSTSCGSAPGCELLCSPEGLHPDTKGYDVIAQTITATLLNIDIFAADGAADLEKALGWPAGAVVVKPDLGG